MDINIMEFVTKEFIWVVPILMCFGSIIKKVPGVQDWLIPIITAIFGIIIAGFFNNWTTQSILQGLICGFVATGIHQNIKQPIKQFKSKK